MRNVLLMSAAASLLALPAWAQEQQTTAGQTNDQVAEQCLEDLRTFSQQMTEEGYWFSGYRQGMGWRGGMARGGMAPASGAAPADPAVDPAARAGTGVGPWGDTGWGVSPRHDIRTLQNAAAVLARQGDEDGCQYLLVRLEDTYANYADQLREAGVEPGQISAWREEQIAASVPVEEMEHVFSLDNILGTELRNYDDEELGSIEDVVLDPETGEIAMAVVGQGGFLGMGENYVVVPWTRLRTTPGLETFLIDATAETLENAPTVDPDQLSGREAFSAAYQDLDNYWQEHQPAQDD
jgi:sporulation protein YlmC with PRC-barrel domain